MQIVNRIRLPDRDLHFAGQIQNGPLIADAGTYQLTKLSMAMAHTTGRRHAVDAGAHVGLWSRVLALHFDRVTAFEPIAEHADCFAANVPSRNVTLHRVALGAESGVISLTQGDGTVGAGYVDPDGSCQVMLRTLDSFGLDVVDLIKIDVEGYEQAVLHGGEQTIRRCRPTVVVEQKKRELRYGFPRLGAVELLKSWGAEIHWIEKGDYCLRWPE